MQSRMARTNELHARVYCNACNYFCGANRVGECLGEGQNMGKIKGGGIEDDYSVCRGINLEEM